MTFQWADYLSLATALLTQQNTFAPEEARCRASISRAYYAVFCAARNYAAVQEGLSLTQSGTDHQAVWQHFQNGPSRTHRQLSELLERLRIRRNRADYDDVFPNVLKEAQFTILYARQAFHVLETLSP
jgi:uncharacterized protein (UPF0332 family)